MKLNNNISFSLINIFFAIFLLSTKIHAKEEEDGDMELLRKCLAAEDCGSCAELDECGWCGVVGGGVCVPGDSSGSSIEQYDRKECPSHLWRYEDSSCDVSYRKVIKTLSDDVATFSSIEISNQNGNYDASMAVFLLSTAGRPAILMGHGTADKNAADVSVTGAMFDSMLEYADGEQHGLTPDNKESVENRVVLDDFKPISVDTKTDGDQEVYHVITNTTDGVFGLKCVLGNGPFEYEGTTHSPYEMKCDVSIKGYQFSADQNRMALATALVSVDIEKERDEKQEVKFNGGNFLKWSSTYSRSESDSEAAGEVLIADNVIDDSIDTQRPIAKFSVFSFVGDQQGDIFWDPRVGTDPVAAENGEDLEEFRDEVLHDGSGASAVSISGLSCVSLLLLTFVLFF